MCIISCNAFAFKKLNKKNSKIKKKEDISPSFKSVRFPKLQISDTIILHKFDYGAQY